MAHEVVQECDRLRSQGELAAAELDTARGSIQDEVAGHEAGRGGQRLPGSPTATQDRADAGGELGGVKGLGQIVVGAVIESGDPLVGGIDLSEQNDGRPSPARSHPPH